MSYVEIGPLTLYYEVHGSGEPLILLHGAYMNADMMGPLLTGLAAGRQVIVPELEGHARTALTDRPLSYEQMADDVAGLAASLELEQVDVVGYSMGGGAALQTAIRHPPLVRKLVVVSAGYRFDGMPAVAREMFPTITPEMFAGSPMETEYQRLAPNPDDFPRLVEKLTVLDSTDFAWPDDAVRAIPAPMLIVLGDSDGVTLDHAVAMFKLRGGGVMADLQGMPESQLAVLPGTAHFIPPGSGMLDRSEWLLPMIETFLAR